MTVKTTVEALAAQLETISQQISAGLSNIAGDIQNLTGQLAAAATPEEVQAILQPKIDALQAIANQATQIAAIVPDQSGNPEEEL